MKKKPPKISCGMLFLDSGAHTLYHKTHDTKNGMAAHKRFARRDVSYYSSQEFWDYVDRYSQFLKDNPGIDLYANVDVLFSPELSWKVLKYMEAEHGLSPVPVIHFNTDLKWVAKHIEAGYDLIGLGGLGQDIQKQFYYQWADSVFDLLCSNPQRLPVARTHGFAMTAFDLLVRYPWWSVDSASWVKAAAFGGVFVPHKRRGEYTFSVPPYQIKVSADERTVTYIAAADLAILCEWLEAIDVPLGSVYADGREKEWGVVSAHSARKVANLKFFEALCKWLPEWPWPFKVRPRRGLFE